jgi:hypothetical protein
MDYVINELVTNWQKLFSIYGWWSFALVGVSFALMLPVNYGFSKLFAVAGVTALKERLRKVITSLFVFVIAGGTIAAFTVAVAKNELSFSIVYQGSIPCAILAMLVWSLYKLIRDVGIKPVLKAIADSKEFGKRLDEIIPDPNLKNIVKEYIDQKLETVETIDLEKRAVEEIQIGKELAVKLTGLVDDPKDAVDKLMNVFFKGRESA